VSAASSIGAARGTGGILESRASGGLRAAGRLVPGARCRRHGGRRNGIPPATGRHGEHGHERGTLHRGQRIARIEGGCHACEVSYTSYT
jgi:hypothetical protein